MGTKILTDIVLESVNDFAKNQFTGNPYDYLYESDIQVSLFGIIRDRVNKTDYSGKINIPNTSSNITTIDPFKLNLVYTEYGYTRDGKWNPIDIVCLDPSRVVCLEEYKKYVDQNAQIEMLWNQPLLVGIELKYSMYGKYCSYESIKNDFKKMDKYKKDRKQYSPNFQFLCLCFMQDAWSLEMTKECKIPLDPVPEAVVFDSIYFISDKEIFKSEYKSE